MNVVIIRPSRARLAGFAVLALLLVLGCALLVADGGLRAVVGVIGVLFFGVGGGWFIVRHLRGGPTFALTPQGLAPGSGGIVPWPDVAGFGPASAGGAASLGVALADSRAYIASLTPDQVDRALAAARGARAIAPVLGAADPQSAASTAALAAIPTHDLEAAMQWSKQQSGGYDLLFAKLTLDRSIPQLVVLCNDYRAWALSTWSPPPSVTGHAPEPPDPPRQPHDPSGRPSDS